MAVDRRSFIKVSAGAAGGCLLCSQLANASKNGSDFVGNVSMLNDLTRCVGCRACQSACKSHAGLDEIGDLPGVDMPEGLEATNYTVIRRFVGDDKSSFIKNQCMHCNHPSCASACPVGALLKEENGAITYDKKKCIGCRYCMIACPFNVPRFEYDSPTPEIRKCTFCYDEITKGKEPICTTACPSGAITFGTRGELLEEAHRRIEANPERYVDHVYGETEVGGTSVLYVAGISFDQLGFRGFEDTPLPELAENVQHGIFKYFVTPIALFGLLGIARAANMKCDPDDEDCIEE